jgi:hypothetical protein
MDIGPSQGFMGRLGSNIKKNAPMAMNALGQQYGGGMSGAAKVTSGLMQGRMNRQRQGPGMGVNPSGGMPNSPFGKVNFGSVPQQNGQPPTPGMGMSPTIPSNGMPPSLPNNGMGMGGSLINPSTFINPNMGGQLWSNYNNQTMPDMNQQAPGFNKQIFY